MLNTVDHGPNLSNSFLLLLDGVEHDHRVESGVSGVKNVPLSTLVRVLISNFG